MKNRGFVLILVLLMLSIILILTLSQWQSVMVYQKIIGQAAQQQSTLSKLEKIAWMQWRVYASVLTSFEGTQQQTGYRVVEKGQFACVRQQIEGMEFSTAHVEVQTWLVDHLDARLTMRFARPIPLQSCPPKLVRLVTNAVLSWQYH